MLERNGGVTLTTQRLAAAPGAPARPPLGAAGARRRQVTAGYKLDFCVAGPRRGPRGNQHNITQLRANDHQLLERAARHPRERGNLHPPPVGQERAWHAVAAHAVAHPPAHAPPRVPARFHLDFARARPARGRVGLSGRREMGHTIANFRVFVNVWMIENCNLPLTAEKIPVCR